MNSNYFVNPLSSTNSEACMNLIEPLLHNLVTPMLHDRYQILDLLGEGGSGKTYRASDIQQQTEVAIKVLSLRNMKDWKTLELFEREAKILAQLDHGAIPKYIDFFRTKMAQEETFCLVQAIAPGRSLQNWVTSGHVFAEAELRHIAKQILEILIYLQTFTPPVIHRDIKPQNLLYTETGKIYLVDFGAVRDTYHLTITGGSTIVGTYGYMAPEQFRGQALLATDLYGLGTTLLYLASGQDPADLVVQDMKIDFRQGVKTSKVFATWLDGLLEPIPEDRYRTAGLALDYLQGAATIKASRPQQPFSTVSVEAGTMSIVIPPTGYATKKGQRAVISIVSWSLLWLFCFWLFTSTSFTIWSLISLLLILILPFYLILILVMYLGNATARKEIIISSRSATCLSQITENSIEQWIMPLSQLVVIDRGGKSIQLEGVKEVNSPFHDKLVYHRHTYSFGHYLDRTEQLWLIAEINEHIRHSVD
jgi:eukaryotic-like serine/threonine-protein kinase